MFDKDSFMNTTTEAELSTEFIPVPEAEYSAYIGEVTVDSFPRKDGGDGGDVYVMKVFWEIDDDSVEDVTGRDKNTVKQDLFLDLTDSGEIDTASGKNIGLGRLREAVGQNGKDAWSPSQLTGMPAIVNVTHRIYEDQPYAEVKSVREVS